MGKLTGEVQLFICDGGCAFSGSAPGIYPVHAHQPRQISCGTTGQVRLRSSDQEAWTRHDMAIVPSRHPHAFDATDIDCGVVLFVEPETREGRALTERYLHHGIASLHSQYINARLTPRSRLTRWPLKYVSRPGGSGISSPSTQAWAFVPTSCGDGSRMSGKSS